MQTDFDSQLELTFRKKSTWTPAPGADACLDGFIHSITEQLMNSKNRPSCEQNLTKTEREALYNLENNKNIVIKKADKGSAIVVNNSKDYIKMVETHLTNDKFYCQTRTDLTEHHQSCVDKKITQMRDKGEISEKLEEGLRNPNPKTAQLYVLPKVHKNKVNGLYPSRPIISGNGNATEKISHFIDKHLNPLVPKARSYIKDTTDFINKIENITDLPDLFYLVTLDVTSLYTNIPNFEGVVSVARCLAKHRPKYNVSNSSILELLRLVLKCNNFDFNGQHYLQIGGTAMGTRVAPSYANIFMTNLEENLLEKAAHKPHTYKRFIDDIFLIWIYSLKSLEEFIDYLNNAHTTIKFTSEISEDSISFLDTTVYRITGTNKLGVRLFTKDTDTHAYLTYTSSHPINNKQSGPYGQFLRLKRNCTEVKDFVKNAADTKQHYLRRGYPEKIIDKHLEKAHQQDRTQLLHHDKPVKDRFRVPFVTTYNPRNPNFKKIILENWHILKGSSICKEIFTETPIFAYRRNRNIADRLMHSKFTTANQHGKQGRALAFTQTTCSRNNCKYCTKLCTNTSFTSSRTAKTYPKKTEYDCETRNIIYLITCTLCKKQYVGQSKRPCRNRMYEHFRYITKNLDEPTGRHFNLPNHDNTHVKFEIIEVLKKDPDDPRSQKLRNSLEHFWIMQLRTQKPYGINLLLSG